jgi:predicted nucleic acid-binding protein
MSRSCLVDTNVLVRFFTGDPPEMAERAKTLVAQADAGKTELLVPSLIVAEAVYTLESFYEMPKTEVCEKLHTFLRSRGISPLEPDIILDRACPKTAVFQTTIRQKHACHSAN